MKPLHICLSVNNNHMLLSMITIHSVIINNPKAFLYIHILNDGDIHQQDITKVIPKSISNFTNYEIILHNISNHPDYMKVNKTHKHWTKEVYFKILLPSLLSNIDKILYIDTDTVTKGDINKLFIINMENKLFIADRLGGCLCCGVLLINLELARKLNMQDRILSIINTSITSEEMAIMTEFPNYIIYATNLIYTLSTKRKKIDQETFDNIVVIHLVGRKPWEMTTYRKYSHKSVKVWLYNLDYFIKRKHNIGYFFLKVYIIHINKYIFSITKALGRVLKSKILLDLSLKLKKYPLKQIKIKYNG